MTARGSIGNTQKATLWLARPTQYERSVMKLNGPCPATTPDQQLAQRKSWVVGELMLEHPDVTRDEAEAIYERAVTVSRDWRALPVACG
jgi:hypothetical protein